MTDGLTWDQNESGLEYPDHVSDRSISLAETYLTPEWRQALGPTAVLVQHLLAWRIEVGDEKPLFATLKDLGIRIGRDARTLERWLSDKHQRNPALQQWIQARWAYRRRDGRYVSRVGTAFEIKLETPPLSKTNRTQKPLVPTPFKATDQVRVLKLGTMDPGKAIRKLRDR